MARWWPTLVPSFKQVTRPTRWPEGRLPGGCWIDPSSTRIASIDISSAENSASMSASRRWAESQSLNTGMITRKSGSTAARSASGVPRLVTLLADRALEVGCERQARTIDARIVREAARRLNLQPTGIPRWQMQVAAAAAVILILAGGIGWKAIAQRSQAEESKPVVAASAPAAAAVPEIRTLDVRDSVTVTIATLRSEQRAAAIAAQLVEAGFPAFTRRHPDGVSHQVIVGPYVSPDEASAAQRALEAQGVNGSTVRLESTMAGGQ